MFFSMWLKARIDLFEPKGVTTIACYRNEKIGAVLGFSNRHYNRLELTLAIDDPRCCTKGNILAMLYPAFVEPANCMGLSAMTLRKNKRCRKFLEGMGFKQEGVIRSVGPNRENMIHYGLLKSEYMDLVKKYRPNAIEVAQRMMNG